MGIFPFTSWRWCFSATLALAFRVIFFRPEQGQVAIQIPLEFVVEKHADRPAAAALDAGSLFLIEAVQIGVVFDLARLHQAVVDGLITGELVRAS